MPVNKPTLSPIDAEEGPARKKIRNLETKPLLPGILPLDFPQGTPPLSSWKEQLPLSCPTPRPPLRAAETRAKNALQATVSAVRRSCTNGRLPDI